MAVDLLVNIDVPELPRAVEFYEAALGLTLARTIDGDVAELAGAAARIYLLAKPAGSLAAAAKKPARSYERHWTPVHVDFVVDALEPAVQRAVAAGAREESAIVEWRGSRCVTLSDPFGNGFCLIELGAGGYLGDDSAEARGAQP